MSKPWWYIATCCTWNGLSILGAVYILWGLHAMAWVMLVLAIISDIQFGLDVSKKVKFEDEQCLITRR